MLGIAVYAALCVFATQLETQRGFMAMAAVVGLVQGAGLSQWVVLLGMMGAGASIRQRQA